MATGLGSVNVTNLAAQWALAVGTFKGTTTSTKVNNGTTTVTITHGQSVNLSATVTSTSGTPTGDVSFLAPTALNGGIGCVQVLPQTCSQTLNNSGTASFATTFLPGGSYSVKAHYAGDGNFAPSDDPTGVPVVVNPEGSKVQAGIVTFDTTGHLLNTNATSFSYGSPYIFRMEILKSTGTCQLLANPVTTSGCAFDATGTVTLTDSGSPLDGGTFPVNSQGHTEDQPIQLAPGTHALSASYSGDASYSASSSPTDNVTVSKATTATTVVPNPSSITTSTSVTLTATINTQSNGAAPTGTVQFLNGSTPITGTVTYTGQSGAQSATGFATLTATLTTTLSVLPVAPTPRGPLPFAPLLILACISVILALLALRLSQNKRRGLVYASLLLLTALAAGIAGCSGGGSNGPKTIPISAQYSGDTNYSSSSGSTAVTKQ
jgi:Big-like domain-containing protein